MSAENVFRKFLGFRFRRLANVVHYISWPFRRDKAAIDPVEKKLIETAEKIEGKKP